MIQGKEELTAVDAGMHQYIYILNTQLVKQHSKYITTFKLQKFKKSKKINPLNYFLCYESIHFSATIKVNSLDHTFYNCDPTTEIQNAGTLYETVAGMHFIANLPHTDEQQDCIILSKKDSISYGNATKMKRVHTDRLTEEMHTYIYIWETPIGK